MKIFSFPHVVLYELMKQFEPVELIGLSYCSKSAHAVVKTFSKVEEDLKICSVENFGYSIEFPTKMLIGVFSEENMTLLKQDPETHYRFKRWAEGFKHLHICQDVIQGFRETTNYVCDLLNVPVSTVDIYCDSDLWMLDFVEQRQEQPLKNVYAYISDTAGAYSRVMSCNATQDLECGFASPRNYRFDGKLPTSKKLNLTDGSWISRKQFLGLESQYVQLCNTELRRSDIRALLRSWLNGGFPNLKHLTIIGVKIDEEIYDGIRDRLERVQEKVTYKGLAPRRHSLKNRFLFRDFLHTDVELGTNAFHIRREDYIVATVKVFAGLFIMVVWPDTNGNHV